MGERECPQRARGPPPPPALPPQGVTLSCCLALENEALAEPTVLLLESTSKYAPSQASSSAGPPRGTVSEGSHAAPWAFREVHAPEAANVTSGRSDSQRLPVASRAGGKERILWAVDTHAASVPLPSVPLPAAPLRRATPICIRQTLKLPALRCCRSPQICSSP